MRAAAVLASNDPTAAFRLEEKDAVEAELVDVVE